MAIFPVKIIKRSARHRTGRKDYHLIGIETTDGRYMLILRFGKKGAFGQVKVDTFENIREGANAYNVKLDEKMGGEYTERLGESLSVAMDMAELKKLLGPTWFEIGRDKASWLVPGENVSDVRDKAKKFETRGDHDVEVKPPPRLVQEAPPPSDDEQAAKNPLWGLF